MGKLLKLWFAVVGTVIGYFLLILFVLDHWQDLLEKQNFFWLFILLMLPIILFYDKFGKDGLDTNAEDGKIGVAKDDFIETALEPIIDNESDNKRAITSDDLKKALYSIYKNYRSRNNLTKDENSGNFSFTRGYKQKTYTYHIVFFDTKEDQTKLLSLVEGLIAKNYETTIVYIFVIDANDKNKIKSIFKDWVGSGSVMIKTRYDYDL